MSGTARRGARAAGAVLAVFLVGITPAAAQEPIRARPDTAPSDSVPVRARLPTFQPDVPAGPLPPGARLTFTRDSLIWLGAQTLGELLGTIPGVYVARAGFLGLPEYIQYGGRGGAALEIHWDGVRLEPLGTDSLFWDPARIPLTYLARVDVEVRPAGLRVYLVSERHAGAAPRSVVRIMSGVFDTGGYAALFQLRRPTGIALDLGGDFLGTEQVGGPGRSDQRFDLWAKVGWHDELAGVTYQVRRNAVNRAPLPTPAGGPGVAEARGARTDQMFSLRAGTARHGMGFQAALDLVASGWTSDSGFAVPDQSLRQAQLAVGYHRPTWSAALRARAADARTNYAIDGSASWVPVPGVVLAGEAQHAWHPGGRVSSGLHGTVGLYRGPVALVGEIGRREALRAPAIADDQPVETLDRAARLALDLGFVAGAVRVVERDGFAPIAYPDLPLVAALRPTPAATYVVASARLRPSRALTLAAWYSDPIAGAPPDLEPPTHARAEVTLRSKFWRTFRSGAFDLRLQLAMESWSTGAAGVDATGAALALPGATFWETQIAFQIVGFTGFWMLKNMRLAEAGYVPQLLYPRNVQLFGVRWEFFN